MKFFAETKRFVSLSRSSSSILTEIESGDFAQFPNRRRMGVRNLEDTRSIDRQWIDSSICSLTTERNSSSASFKSCIRRRSRALIDRRRVRCLRSPITLLIDGECCWSGGGPRGERPKGNGKFHGAGGFAIGSRCASALCCDNLNNDEGNPMPMSFSSSTSNSIPQTIVFSFFFFIVVVVVVGALLI